MPVSSSVRSHFTLAFILSLGILLVSCSSVDKQTSSRGLLAPQVESKTTYPKSPEGIRPILIGSQMPTMSLKNESGEIVDLGSISKKKPLVLIFYRGGWCPYCNLQLQGLKKIEGRLKKLGYEIIAVSPDRPEELAKTDSKNKLSYTLISDSKAELATAMGVAFEVEPAMVEKYKGWNIDLEAASGEKHHLLPVPAVFLVGTDGKVKFQYVNPDYKVRLPEAVILAAAEASFEPLKPGGK